MNHSTKKRALFARCAQGGFSLIELMVAVAIAMFLIAGLVTVLQHTRTTSVMQTQMAGLQDGERLAMSLMAGVVESAGYFPNPVLNSAIGTMPIGAGSSFATPGTPVVTGTSNFNAQGDSFTVRYAAAQNDNIFNCQGGTNTAVAPFDSWENTFYVIPGPAGTQQNQLVCVLWTASTQVPSQPIALVSGVQNMTVVYGVQTNGGATQTCTDTYMSAAQVTAAAAWANVCSVVVTLTFFDPTYPAGSGRTVPPFTRVIALMQTAGVT